MKKIILTATVCLSGLIVKAQDILVSQNDIEQNKAIVRDFYQDLWFNDNTDKYSKYVADTYVVHDIGDRKGISEPAVEQKNIADFFWKHGEIGGEINYQVAEGDLVATHWTSTFNNPKTLFGRFILGRTEPFSIINVVRIKDGKIVEFWNHRHDIETPQTLKFVMQGLVIGLLIALIPTFFAIRFRSKMKKLLKPTR